MLSDWIGARRDDLLRYVSAAQERFPLARSLTAVVGGTALGQALIFASTPAIARLYTQTEIGTFGLFLSFLSVAGLAVTARYEVAIPGAGDDGEAFALLSLSLRLSAALSCVASLVLWFMIANNVLSFGTVPTWAALVILPCTAATGAFAAMRLWLVRERSFGVIGRVVALQGTGRATVPLLLRPASPGAFGLIAGELAGRLLGLGRMLAISRSARRRLKPSRPRLAGVAASHWKNPVILLPSGLMDSLALALPVPLISSHFGLAAAGTFVLVQRLSSIPAALIGAGAGDVFHSTFVAAYGRGPHDARRTLRTAARHLVVVALAGMVPCALLAPTVIPWLLGPRWAESGWLFVALAPWATASFVIVPTSRVIVVVDRKETKLLYDCTALLLMIGTISICARSGFGFVETIAFTSVGQVLAYLLYYVLLDVASGSLNTARPVAQG